MRRCECADVVRWYGLYLVVGKVELMSAGRAIAGFAVGQLTMVVPFYISEVRTHSAYLEFDSLPG